MSAPVRQSAKASQYSAKAGPRSGRIVAQAGVLALPALEQGVALESVERGEQAGVDGDRMDRVAQRAAQSMGGLRPFEVGMYQLGGNALSLSPQEIQMAQRETPSDTKEPR